MELLLALGHFITPFIKDLKLRDLKNASKLHFCCCCCWQSYKITRKGTECVPFMTDMRIKGP